MIYVGLDDQNLDRNHFAGVIKSLELSHRYIRLAREAIEATKRDQQPSPVDFVAPRLELPSAGHNRFDRFEGY